ncbi:MAG: hypothetical protein H7336_16435 [Bacteriovorax sp.]|nr:hypothetical protein [Bacteriovorax sp.]
MKLLIALFLISSSAQANFPEMFGASFTTSSIGNQANMDANDPSNNYYAPSLLGFSDKFNVVLEASSTAVHPKEINNIIITNGTNSNNPSTTGKANTNYTKFYGGAIHAAVPIGGASHLGTLGLSVFLPIGNLVQTNSGNPFLPEYVMYRSRHEGTSVFVNFAKKLSDDLSFSLGTILGFQASAEVRTNMSLNGASYGSWASGQAKVSPSLGAIASVTKMFDNNSLYFTYQQEMKSNLKTTVNGEITNPSLALLDSRLDSMIFYEPHTFRIGGAMVGHDIEYFAGVEYQMWSGYKTPIMTVAKTGGVVVPSSNYEKIQIRDTINPRIGLKLNVTDRWSTMLGGQYRMTPLKGDFSGSGNSVDTNTIVGTTGLDYRMVIWSKDIHIGASFQYHHLMEKKVVKTTRQEDGTAGQKIGAPGYDIGGYILAGALGVKFNF